MSKLFLLDKLIVLDERNDEITLNGTVFNVWLSISRLHNNITLTPNNNFFYSYAAISVRYRMNEIPHITEFHFIFTIRSMALRSPRANTPTFRYVTVYASALRWLVRTSTVKHSQQNAQHAGVVADCVLFFSFLPCAKNKKKNKYWKSLSCARECIGAAQCGCIGSASHIKWERDGTSRELHVCAFCVRRQPTEIATETVVSISIRDVGCAFVCDWRK